MKDEPEQPLHELYEKLEIYERELNTPLAPRKNLVSSIFGETKQMRKRREKDEQKRQINIRERRAQMVSTFPVPKDAKSVVQFAQLAITQYQMSKTPDERKVWKVKLQQAIDTLDMLAFENTTELGEIDVRLAYLRGKLREIEEAESREKRLFVTEVAGSFSLIVAAIALAESFPGVAIAEIFVPFAIIGSILYWTIIRRKLRK